MPTGDRAPRRTKSDLFSLAKGRLHPTVCQASMWWRGLSRLGRDPLWLVLAASFILGLVGGDLIARIQTDEGWTLLGHASIADTDEARAILTTMFGLQLTVLTIVLSLNAPMIQSAANQYSPRLVPFYLKHAPIRQAFPPVVLARNVTFSKGFF